MSFMITSAIVVPIAKTIGSFLFGRIGDGFVDNALIRRKTKKILTEDRKKINSHFNTEPEKEKMVEDFLFNGIFQDQAFLYPVSTLPDDRVTLLWEKYCIFGQERIESVPLLPEDKTRLVDCVNNHNALIGKFLLNNSDRLLLGVLERDRSDMFGYVGKTLNSDSDLQYSNDCLDYAHKQIEGVLHALRMDQRHYKILLMLYSVGFVAFSVILALVLPSVLPKLTWSSWSSVLTLSFFVFIIAFIIFFLFILFRKSYQRVTRYENRITGYMEELWAIHYRCYQSLFYQICFPNSERNEIEVSTDEVYAG